MLDTLRGNRCLIITYVGEEKVYLIEPCRIPFPTTHHPPLFDVSKRKRPSLPPYISTNILSMCGGRDYYFPNIQHIPDSDPVAAAAEVSAVPL